MSIEMFSLAGRRALITGSSQGIGLALAEGLAKAGASVVLNGRDEAKLAAENVARIEASQGPIDILINNAGMQFRTSLEDFPIEKWRELMRVNVESAFIVGKAVAKGMISRKRGKIINIGSVQSELGRPTIAPYTATKGAIKMLTKGMCADWARHGIQVNAIGPGYFKTPLNQALVDNPEFSSWLEKRTPSGRWGTTDELIGAAIFLSSDASSFVNGHMLYVDGGITSVL
jgi:gluconate 5-dehydrogenase